MQRWVVLTFYSDSTYSTLTYDTFEEALDVYNHSKSLGEPDKQVALVLEGSELPIKGYVPGKMAIREKIETK